MWIALGTLIGLIVIVAIVRGAYNFARPLMDIKLSADPTDRLAIEAERREWELAVAEELYPEPQTLNRLHEEALQARERANQRPARQPVREPKTVTQPERARPS